MNANDTANAGQNKPSKPHCGIQGNNLVIAPDKGQTRYSAWVISRDSEGSEEMVTDCLEIPLIGIGTTAPPIIKENILEAFTWNEGHPSSGINYFLQVFAYGPSNDQSDPEEIRLTVKPPVETAPVSKSPDKTETKTDADVATAAKSPELTRQEVAEKASLDRNLSHAKSWLKQESKPVVGCLNDRRPVTEVIENAEKFQVAFGAELARYEIFNPNDSRVVELRAYFDKFSKVLTDLKALKVEREQAANAASQRPSQPSANSQQPETAATPAVTNTGRIAPQSDLNEINLGLTRAENALDERRLPAVNSILETADRKVSRLKNRYPDTDPAAVKAITDRITAIRNEFDAVVDEANRRREAATAAANAAKATTAQQQPATAQQQAQPAAQQQPAAQAQPTAATQQRQPAAQAQLATAAQPAAQTQQPAQQANAQQPAGQGQAPAGGGGQQAVALAPWYIRYRMRILAAVITAVLLGLAGMAIRWFVGRSGFSLEPTFGAVSQETPRSPSNRIAPAGSPGINNVEIKKTKGNILLQSPISFYVMTNSPATLKAAEDLVKLVSSIPAPAVTNCVLFELKPEEIAGTDRVICARGRIGPGDFALIVTPNDPSGKVWTYHAYRSLGADELVSYNDSQPAANVVAGNSREPVQTGVSQARFWLKPGVQKMCDVNVTFYRPQ